MSFRLFAGHRKVRHVVISGDKMDLFWFIFCVAFKFFDILDHFVFSGYFFFCFYFVFLHLRYRFWFDVNHTLFLMRHTHTQSHSSHPRNAVTSWWWIWCVVVSGCVCVCDVCESWIIINMLFASEQNEHLERDKYERRKRICY